MEFDIGNILYIVITLVVVIVGILGKKKKPAGPDTGKSEGQARPGFLENLEKVFLMGQPEPAVEDLQEYEEDLQEEAWKDDPVPEAPKVMSMMEEYNQRVSDRQKTRKKDGNLSDRLLEPLEVVQLDDDWGTDYFDVVKDFDAGTAVVYSAIINRLDY